MPNLFCYLEKKKPTEIEAKILDFILTHKSFEQYFYNGKVARWTEFLHLSKRRESLLAWYDFLPHAEVLEVAAGFGALTGLLCRRAGHVTVTERSVFRAEIIAKRYHYIENLDIYAGDLLDLKFNKKFDYIVLAGILELQGDGSPELLPYIKYLEKVKKLLKPCGKILISVDNRLGLKYFCGEKFQYSGKSFSALNAEFMSRGYNFSKAELVTILKEAKLNFYKFYYPLPDYRFPQIIYSEKFLPTESIGERLKPYYLNKEGLILSEKNLYKDIIENHIFECMANSFFIECSIENNLSKIDFATVTADRGKEWSSVTCIRGKQSVEKRSFFGNTKGIRNLIENLDRLGKRGIDVISYEYKNGIMTMPFVAAPVLGDYLRKLSMEDRDQIFHVFDKLWDCILRSSDQIDIDKNVLLKRNKIIDYGPVLETVYLEMMPMNCFFENDKFLFFDQEFTKDNYPAKYPLFRAIHYSGSYIDHIVSVEELKERYRFSEALWNIFISEEMNFLQEVHNDIESNLFEDHYKENFSKIERNQKLLNVLGNE